MCFVRPLQEFGFTYSGTLTQWLDYFMAESGRLLILYVPILMLCATCCRAFLDCSRLSLFIMAFNGSHYFCSIMQTRMSGVDLCVALKQQSYYRHFDKAL